MVVHLKRNISWNGPLIVVFQKRNTSWYGQNHRMGCGSKKSGQVTWDYPLGDRSTSSDDPGFHMISFQSCPVFWGDQTKLSKLWYSSSHNRMDRMAIWMANLDVTYPLKLMGKLTREGLLRDESHRFTASKESCQTRTSRENWPRCRENRGARAVLFEGSIVPGLSQGRGGAWDHRRCGTHLTQWSFGLTFLIPGLAWPVPWVFQELLGGYSAHSLCFLEAFKAAIWQPKQKSFIKLYNVIKTERLKCLAEASRSFWGAIQATAFVF